MASFVIAHLFMSVYSISAEAILQCYCMDQEMNGTAIHAPQVIRSHASIPNPNTKKMMSDYK